MNTGARAENAATRLAIADGAIVCTYFKHDGVFENRATEPRVRELMQAVAEVRRPATALACPVTLEARPRTRVPGPRLCRARPDRPGPQHQFKAGAGVGGLLPARDVARPFLADRRGPASPAAEQLRFLTFDVIDDYSTMIEDLGGADVV